MRFTVGKSEPEGQMSQYMPQNFRFIAVGDESAADKSKHIYVLLKKDKPHLMSTDLKIAHLQHISPDFVPKYITRKDIPATVFSSLPHNVMVKSPQGFLLMCIFHYIRLS